MKKEKKGCCGNFLWIIIILLVASIFIKDDDSNENPETEEIVAETDSKIEQTEPFESETLEFETEKPKTFVEQLAEYTDSSTAEEILRIYKEEIGFDTVEFDKKMEGTENYYIWANNYHTVITATDGYYRAFAPGTSYVFYEDGNVLLTADDFVDSLISSEDMIYYYDIAKEIVETCLKSPSTADFPSKSEITYQKKGNLVAIQGYVDAVNSFNAEIRSDFLVQFYVYDLKNFSYETTYIQIDEETTGEFIEF